MARWIHGPDHATARSGPRRLRGAGGLPQRPGGARPAALDRRPGGPVDRVPDRAGDGRRRRARLDPHRLRRGPLPAMQPPAPPPPGVPGVRAHRRGGGPDRGALGRQRRRRAWLRRRQPHAGDLRHLRRVPGGPGRELSRRRPPAPQGCEGPSINRPTSLPAGDRQVLVDADDEVVGAAVVELQGERDDVETVAGLHAVGAAIGDAVAAERALVEGRGDHLLVRQVVLGCDLRELRLHVGAHQRERGREVAVVHRVHPGDRGVAGGGELAVGAAALVVAHRAARIGGRGLRAAGQAHVGVHRHHRRRRAARGRAGARRAGRGAGAGRRRAVVVLVEDEEQHDTARDEDDDDRGDDPRQGALLRRLPVGAVAAGTTARTARREAAPGSAVRTRLLGLAVRLLRLAVGTGLTRLPVRAGLTPRLAVRTGLSGLTRLTRLSGLLPVRAGLTRLAVLTAVRTWRLAHRASLVRRAEGAGLARWQSAKVVISGPPAYGFARGICHGSVTKRPTPTRPGSSGRDACSRPGSVPRLRPTTARRLLRRAPWPAGTRKVSRWNSNSSVPIASRHCSVAVAWVRSIGPSTPSTTGSWRSRSSPRRSPPTGATASASAGRPTSPRG